MVTPGKRRDSLSANIALALVLALGTAVTACGSNDDPVEETPGTGGTIGGTTGGTTGGGTGAGDGTGTVASTVGVLCSYSSSVANTSPSVNTTSTSAWTCTSAERVLAANGIPDHDVGEFPNADNPNAISAQNVSASYTLSPVATTTATELGGPRGVTGFILNGVKIDAGTAGSCNDDGTSCSLIDNSGGWAADGFPIYARYGYTTATDASSPIKSIVSSYRLKATPDATRPSTDLYPLGTFLQDYEYVAGSGDLDECNGRTGVTPEFPGGIYHYYGTDTYPYLQRCVKGAVAAATGPGGPPPQN